MYKILHKQVLAQHIKKLDIAAATIASKVVVGQFVMVGLKPLTKQIPLSVVDWDAKRGTISLIVHEVGEVSSALGALSIGDVIDTLVGPLGKPAVIDRYGVVIAIATGIGAAQVLPICRALKKQGNRVIGVMGAKSKSVLMLESQMRVVCDELYITTNDGSYERKGLASALLAELMTRYQVKAIYAIGGAEMMKAATQFAMASNIPAWVTINTYMVNGLGHCGSCRLKVAGKMVLSCVDGPHFDGRLVDFNDVAYRYLQMENTCKTIIKPTSLWGYLTQSLGLTKKQV